MDDLWQVPRTPPGSSSRGPSARARPVVTQVIGSITSGRREKRRFAWERDTQKRERNRQERDRFLDLKRELYSNFAFGISNLMGYTHAFNYPDDPGPARLDLEELRRLQWNIDIIASKAVGKSVADSLEALMAAKNTAESEHVEWPRKIRDAEHAEAEWWKTYDLLRDDLGVSELQPVPIRLPQPGPPPPRPAGRVTSWPKFKAWCQYRKMLKAYRRTVGRTRA
jgi:hypothetical protein